MGLMSWGPTVHPGWVKALSDGRIRSARLAVEISQDWVQPPVSMDQITCHSAVWGHDQQTELTLAFTTRGRLRVRPCLDWLSNQGQRWLQWTWRVQAGSERMSRNKQTPQKEAIPWVCHCVSQCSTLQLPAPCPAGEPNREAATSQAQKHSRHRSRSEIPASHLPQLLSSEKMIKTSTSQFQLRDQLLPLLLTPTSFYLSSSLNWFATLWTNFLYNLL